MKKHILIVGACGSGKTWVLKELIKLTQAKITCKFNLIRFLMKDNLCILGKYTGDIFDGSDKLSMAVSRDFLRFNKFVSQKQLVIVAEGARFTNKKFIATFNPLIVKIKDNGESGRRLRGSNQTNKHIKRIHTTVANVQEDFCCNNSKDALLFITKQLSI